MRKTWPKPPNQPGTGKPIGSCPPSAHGGKSASPTKVKGA